jgi:hypothetical protein
MDVSVVFRLIVVLIVVLLLLWIQGAINRSNKRW